MVGWGVFAFVFVVEAVTGGAVVVDSLACGAVVAGPLAGVVVVVGDFAPEAAQAPSNRPPATRIGSNLTMRFICPSLFSQARFVLPRKFHSDLTTCIASSSFT